MMIGLSSITAFVDEYGDANLSVDKAGTSTFFIITAVLVSTERLAEQTALAEDIRRTFFQTGEMKSASIGGNHERRRKVLEALKGLQLFTYSLAIDKRELHKAGGLAWKGSFFKYVNRRLYQRLYRAFENTDLVADEHGSDEFMVSFEGYVKRELQTDLFARRTFRFAKSHSEVFLQVADLLSGTLARSLDPKKQTSMAMDFMRLVSEFSLGIEVWPPKRLPPPRGFLRSVAEDSETDEIVRSYCLRVAQQFVASDVNEADDSLRARNEVVSYLLFQAQFVDEEAFVPTAVLLDYLRQHTGVHLSEHQFRSSVISQLRDADVIIASSSRGYKIPTRVSDVHEFVAHANTMIPPMLRRIRRARDDLLTASSGEVDVLKEKALGYLRRLVAVEP